MSLYYREQKHICGKDYATAGYMEVDLYPVTPKQHKASRRATVSYTHLTLPTKLEV